MILKMAILSSLSLFSADRKLLFLAVFLSDQNTSDNLKTLILDALQKCLNEMIAVERKLMTL